MARWLLRARDAEPPGHPVGPTRVRVDAATPMGSVPGSDPLHRWFLSTPARYDDHLPSSEKEGDPA